MPGDSGVLVVARVRSITTSAHEAAGALGIRHSPRPLRGGRFINASDASRREVANVRLGVIASAAKQSILYFTRRDGLLRFARNDVIVRLSRHTLSRHRPRMRAIQYSEASMMESIDRGVLGTPLSRSMTIFARSGLSRRSSTSEGGSDEAIHPFFLAALSTASRAG